MFYNATTPGGKLSMYVCIYMNMHSRNLFLLISLFQWSDSNLLLACKLNSRIFQGKLVVFVLSLMALSHAREKLPVTPVPSLAERIVSVGLWWSPLSLALSLSQSGIWEICWWQRLVAALYSAATGFKFPTALYYLTKNGILTTWWWR